MHRFEFHFLCFYNNFVCFLFAVFVCSYCRCFDCFFQCDALPAVLRLYFLFEFTFLVSYVCLRIVCYAFISSMTSFASIQFFVRFPSVPAFELLTSWLKRQKHRYEGLFYSSFCLFFHVELIFLIEFDMRMATKRKTWKVEGERFINFFKEKSENNYNNTMCSERNQFKCNEYILKSASRCDEWNFSYYFYNCGHHVGNNIIEMFIMILILVVGIFIHFISSLFSQTTDHTKKLSTIGWKLQHKKKP